MKRGHDIRPSAWYALPLILFFGCFAVLPLGLVGYLSFTDYDPLLSPVFNGTDNWQRLLDDEEAWDALRRTIFVAVGSWLLQTPLALLIGVWAAGQQRNRALLSALFFLPLLLSTAAVALLWNRFVDFNFGVTPSLPLVGDVNFLGDQELVLYTVVWVIAWQYVPFHTLLYQGAARAIPKVLYEAATMDGASRVQQFFRVTLPQLRYTMVTSTIMILVGSLTTFDTVLILTNGGPGTASRIAPLHMYITGFRGFEAGYASTIAVLLVVLGALLSFAVVRLTGYRSMSSQQEGL
ncbi:sugar ABC transporter permease [Nocardioides sp. TF02-7]|uniref:carbohydrate ABC transporter permease n=1 Tax=Nocardioides sp. TF02-7 TaxID=2917724 RepID=UPI001F06A81B|nr:sugar ABC transporter permease [Nocardioides sp. TF02-7]UMG93149.1 sugar ABC transporter permease [Nocardioides sp. TF02-7]